MPQTFGSPPISSPNILLPTSATSWPAHRTRTVLLHELAHIKRHDCLTQLIAHFACCLYYFNPLVWFAAHRMNIERERACDDLVLTITENQNNPVKPSDYAQLILDIATTSTTPSALSFLTSGGGGGGIQMANKNTFEKRILAILDPKRIRTTLTKPKTLLITLLLFSLTIPTAMLTAASNQPKPSPKILGSWYKISLTEPLTEVIQHIHPSLNSNDNLGLSITLNDNNTGQIYVFDTNTSTNIKLHTPITWKKNSGHNYIINATNPNVVPIISNIKTTKTIYREFLRFNKQPAIMAGDTLKFKTNGYVFSPNKPKPKSKPLPTNLTGNWYAPIDQNTATQLKNQHEYLRGYDNLAVHLNIDSDNRSRANIYDIATGNPISVFNQNLDLSAKNNQLFRNGDQPYSIPLNRNQLKLIDIVDFPPFTRKKPTANTPNTDLPFIGNWYSSIRSLDQSKHLFSPESLETLMDANCTTFAWHLQFTPDNKIYIYAFDQRQADDRVLKWAGSWKYDNNILTSTFYGNSATSSLANNNQNLNLNFYTKEPFSRHKPNTHKLQNSLAGNWYSAPQPPTKFKHFLDDKAYNKIKNVPAVAYNVEFKRDHTVDISFFNPTTMRKLHTQWGGSWAIDQFGKINTTFYGNHAPASLSPDNKSLKMEMYGLPTLKRSIPTSNNTTSPSTSTSSASPRTENPYKTPTDVDDVADILASKITLDNAGKKSYILMDHAETSTQTKSSPRPLILILPGGDGSEDFHFFCRRLYKFAALKADPSFIAAQPIAPVWNSQQANNVVWPNKYHKFRGMKFSTETFIQDIINDIASNHNIDRSRIIALGWSSAGPAVYDLTLQPNSPITGSFAAMSVFKPKPQQLKYAKNKPVFIYHGSKDALIDTDRAFAAESKLKAKGANVHLKIYNGPHGWFHSGLYSNTADGLTWLLDQSSKKQQPTTSTPQAATTNSSFLGDWYALELTQPIRADLQKRLPQYKDEYHFAFHCQINPDNSASLYVINPFTRQRMHILYQCSWEKIDDATLSLFDPQGNTIANFQNNALNLTNEKTILYRLDHPSNQYYVDNVVPNTKILGDWYTQQLSKDLIKTMTESNPNLAKYKDPTFHIVINKDRTAQYFVYDKKAAKDAELLDTATWSRINFNTFKFQSSSYSNYFSCNDDTLFNDMLTLHRTPTPKRTS